MTPPPFRADDVFVDQDGDGWANMIDEDSDGDGVPDQEEGVDVAGGNGLPAFLAQPRVGVAPEEIELDVVIEEDVVYAIDNGRELKLDIARPRKGKGPFPLIADFLGTADREDPIMDRVQRCKINASEFAVSIIVGCNEASRIDRGGWLWTRAVWITA